MFMVQCLGSMCGWENPNVHLHSRSRYKFIARRIDGRLEILERLTF